MKYPNIESKVLEFKERVKDYSRFVETITAFSNSQGGTIILGIRDGDREILGLEEDQIDRYHSEIPQVVADTVSPQISLDIYEQNREGKTCLVIRVFPGSQKPYFVKKMGYPAGVYLRFGPHNRQADDFALEELTRQKTGRRFEMTPCPGITFSDLSRDLLQKIFTDPGENLFIGAGFGTADVTGRTIPNAAGTLLFYPGHRDIIPESYISIAHYAGRDKQNMIRSESFEGGLHASLETAFVYLMEILGKNYQLNGVVRQPGDYDIPAPALREAMVNAVVHRAYDYEAPIRIAVFSDRVEFLNPGVFFAPINQENLREGLSRYRNPLIADALRKTGHIEKQGIGISLILSSCSKAGLKEPLFQELENHVKVVLFRIKDSRRTSGVSGTTASGTEADARKIIESVETISSAELAHRLGKSQALAKKILQKFQNTGFVVREGSGPSTRYRGAPD